MTVFYTFMKVTNYATSPTYLFMHLFEHCDALHVLDQMVRKIRILTHIFFLVGLAAQRWQNEVHPRACTGAYAQSVYHPATRKQAVLHSFSWGPNFVLCICGTDLWGAKGVGVGRQVGKQKIHRDTKARIVSQYLDFGVLSVMQGHVRTLKLWRKHVHISKNFSCVNPFSGQIHTQTLKYPKKIRTQTPNTNF